MTSTCHNQLAAVNKGITCVLHGSSKRLCATADFFYMKQPIRIGEGAIKLTSCIAHTDIQTAINTRAKVKGT